MVTLFTPTYAEKPSYSRKNGCFKKSNKPGWEAERDQGRSRRGNTLFQAASTVTHLFPPGSPPHIIPVINASVGESGVLHPWTGHPPKSPPVSTRLWATSGYNHNTCVCVEHLHHFLIPQCSSSASSVPDVQDHLLHSPPPFLVVFPVLLHSTPGRLRKVLPGVTVPKYFPPL